MLYGNRIHIRVHGNEKHKLLDLFAEFSNIPMNKDSNLNFKRRIVPLRDQI